MKLSFITTVLNEEGNIEKLLKSLSSQTVLPDEVIIVDGGSSDRTIAEIKYQISNIKNDVKFKILIKKGNRSIGRNEAIKNARGDIILSSDAGCVLDKNWVKNIIKPFENKKNDVVSGYYKGTGETVFEKSLIPYVLVMENRLSPENFLPATRSMAFKKEIWKKAGRFDEKLSHNEDFEFAKRLKKVGANIKFAKDAIVYWRPRKNIKEAFIMFYRFAFGDAEAGIIRPKVIFLFARYSVGILFVFIYLYTNSLFLLILIFTLLGNYILWAMFKNYRYINNKRALIYLPLLQFTADFSVLLGTTIGFLKSFFIKK